MEVILTKDVESVGFKDEIVKVKNGYGRNYLIPKGMAVMATPSARKIHEETLRQRAHKEKHQIEEATKVAQKLKELQVKVIAKAGPDGKLFGSVTNLDLVEVLSKQGHTIERKFVKVTGTTIKKTGNYTANIRLHRLVDIDIPFEVVTEAK